MKFLGSIGFPHAVPERTHAEEHVRGGEIVVDLAERRGRPAEVKPEAPPFARHGHWNRLRRGRRSSSAMWWTSTTASGA